MPIRIRTWHIRLKVMGIMLNSRHFISISRENRDQIFDQCRFPGILISAYRKYRLPIVFTESSRILLTSLKSRTSCRDVDYTVTVFKVLKTPRKQGL